ncbi:MAG: hypothetical protein ACI4TB_09275 [Lachnospiraceae bacterium]
MNNSKNLTATLSAAQEKLPAENRNYKDTLFRLIFKEPKELLSLYNAIHDTRYTKPEELQIVTLENGIYMCMKNDLACIVDCHLSLYEHQSTFNPNMPLRDLFYVAKEYEKLLADKTLYASTLVKIPAPSFITFYNGKEKQPERLEMKLSDAFEIPMDKPALELHVIQLNINTGFNKELMKKCRTLQEYTLYVERVRKYAEEKPLKEAVEQAVQECIKEGILDKFLTRYRREAVSVSIFEYDEEREIALIRKAEREAGADLFAALTAKLLQDARTEDLQQATTNKEFRDALYLEYGIIADKQ